MKNDRDIGRLILPESTSTSTTGGRSYAQLLEEGWTNLNSIFQGGDIRAFAQASDRYARQFIEWWAGKLQTYQQAFGITNFEDWQNVPGHVLSEGSDRFSVPRITQTDPYGIRFRRVSPEGKDEIYLWFDLKNNAMTNVSLDIETGVGVPPANTNVFTAISPDFPLVFDVSTKSGKLTKFERKTRIGDEKADFYATKTEALALRESVFKQIPSPKLPS